MAKQYGRARQAAAMSRQDGLIALKKSDASTALQLAEKAEALNPGFLSKFYFARTCVTLALGKK